MSRLREKFERREWVTSIQLDPPIGHDPGYLLELLNDVAKYGIRVADINSSAKNIRHDSLATARNLEELGIITIPHVRSRDGHPNSILGRIKGVAAEWHDFSKRKSSLPRVTNILVICGDPREDEDKNPSNYVDSPELIRLMDEKLRKEHGFHLYIGCAFTQTHVAQEARKKEIERLELKIKAGADFVMTQPLFYHFRWKKEVFFMRQAIQPKFFVGLWPIFDKETEEKIANGKLPGVVLPEETRRRLDSSSNCLASQASWIAEMIQEMQGLGIAGVYIVTPRKRNHQEFLALLEMIRKQGGIF